MFELQTVFLFCLRNYLGKLFSQVSGSEPHDSAFFFCKGQEFFGRVIFCYLSFIQYKDAVNDIHQVI